VGNIITSTGAAGHGFCTGFPCAAVQSAFWAGYGVYQNVIVKNNYADMRRIGGGFSQSSEMTGRPFLYNRPFGLSLPSPPVAEAWRQSNFASSYPETSTVEDGNVMMTNGACFSVWTRQTAC
jgi:hypothetical protein